MAVKSVSKLKRRKKRWYPILAPKRFNNKVLGESYIADPSLLMGKNLTLNLMTVTGEMRNQNINMSFEVTNVTDGKGYTDIVGYTMIPTSLKRFVRRGRSRIDDSIILKTADKKFVELKPVIITQSLATRLIKTQIRLQTRKVLFNQAQKYSYDKLFTEILFQKAQRHLKDVLKKIIPVKSVGIRMFKLLKNEPKIYLTKADYKLKKEIVVKKPEAKPEEKPKEEAPAAEKKPKAEEKKELPKEVEEKKPAAKKAFKDKTIKKKTSK